MVEALRALTSIVERAIGGAASYSNLIAEDLLSMTPPALLGRLSSGRRFVTIDVSHPTGKLRAVLPDGRTSTIDDPPQTKVIAVATEHRMVALRVSDGGLISTTLRLPGRAAAKLDEVVRNNIAVWTPFTADEVYCKARIVTQAITTGSGRDPAISAKLRCVPKAAINPSIQALAEAGIGIDEIWLGSGASFAIRIESLKRVRMRRARRSIMALAGLAVTQVLVLAGLYRTAQHDAIAELMTRLDRVRTEIHEHAMQAQKAAAIKRTLGTIRARAAGPDSATQSLNLLGRVLPAGAKYRDIRIAHAGDGNLTIVSRDKIDPVAVVAATGLLTVTEVNELGSAQSEGHVYNVAFKPFSSREASE